MSTIDRPTDDIGYFCTMEATRQVNFPLVTITLGDESYSALLDTGSEITAVDENVFRMDKSTKCVLAEFKVTNVRLRGAFKTKRASVHQ